jgi:AraC-like DNA-binding protein
VCVFMKSSQLDPGRRFHRSGATLHTCSSTISNMDAYGDLFAGIRARGSLFGSTTLTAPWALLFVDGPPLTLCTVIEGSGWLLQDGLPPQFLAGGDTVVVKGPAPFSFVDEPGTSAEPIECGEECAAPDLGGTRHRLGWHDAGPGGDAAATTLVVGAYPVGGQLGRRLLDEVPALLRVDTGGTTDAVRDLLVAEVAIDAPGQQVVLDRLLDWMLVCALREWFDRPGGRPPAWYSANKDPVVGPALRLLHTEPSAPWTVSALAEQGGVSRALFARKFVHLVGVPPMTYLTDLRMTLAADMLTGDRSVTIAEIACATGYSDAFGFSAAFKRERGINPSDYRRTAEPASLPPRSSFSHTVSPSTTPR